MSDSLRPHGLQPTTLLCPWDFPGKSTGVGCHCLLHRVPTHPYNSGSHFKVFSLATLLPCVTLSPLCCTVYHKFWRFGNEQFEGNYSAYQNTTLEIVDIYKLYLVRIRNIIVMIIYNVMLFKMNH